MYHHDFDRQIERIARRQCGGFSHHQALRVGGSDHMILTRLRTGLYVRLCPGVYALASYPGSFHRQCWAAVLSAPDAAVGGLSAAHLEELNVFRAEAEELLKPKSAVKTQESAKSESQKKD